MNKYSLYTEGYTTMKKFVSLLLALMMALSLVACGSKADTTTDDKTDDDTVTEPANALERSRPTAC